MGANSERGASTARKDLRASGIRRRFAVWSAAARCGTTRARVRGGGQASTPITIRMHPDPIAGR
jgi:hypothetical protein